MIYTVVVPRKVEREIDTIADYIAKQSKSGVVSWLTAYEKALDTLRNRPEACSLAPEDEHFDHQDIRQHLFKTRKGKLYRLVFRIESPNIVRLLAVRGPGQDFVPADELLP